MNQNYFFVSEEISFEEISFEEISFEETSFEEIFFEDITYEEISFQNISIGYIQKSIPKNSTRINTSQHKVRTYSSYDMLSFTLCLSRISMQIACCNLIYQDRHLPLCMKTIHNRSFIYPTMQVNDMTMVVFFRVLMIDLCAEANGT